MMNKIKFFYDQHKKELGVALVFVVIEELFLKVGGEIISIMPGVGFSILIAIKDAIFRYAAASSVGTVLINLFAIMFAAAVAPVMMKCNTAIAIEKRNKRLKKRESLLKDLKSANRNKRKELKLKAKILRVDKAITREEDNAKTLNPRFLLAYVIFFMFHIFTFVVYPEFLRQDYETTMTKIAPYVDNQTIIELKSEWVRMKGYGDYQEVKQKVKVIEEQNKL